MTDAFALPRRGLLIGTAAALLPLREVLAQTRHQGGDWFAMVKAHHQMIARSLERLADADDKLYARRDQALRAVAYQLTAHSVAEENVLYPALFTAGLVTETDRLYLDQAHAKVANAQLQMVPPVQRSDAAWFEKVKALRDAVMKHALEDEEGRYYPALQAKLDARGNAMLTDAYEREFVAVKARTWATTPG